jgi:hypothetical protein
MLAVACGAPDASTPLAPPPTANVDFPKPYVAAGDWHEIEFVPIPGALDRVPTLAAALIEVRTYFLAGIHTQVPDAGVTVVHIGSDPSAKTVTLLVTQIGGANSAVAGRQERVVLHQDERGWWMDPMGEDRVYCLKPLGGVAGTSCVD